MKPRIGIFGLSGCWGEQIVILNCENELLDIVGAVDLVDFLGGSSANDTEGPLDVAFVEGSVGSLHDERALRRIRERARLLVACGTCACFGGVAALDTGRPRQADVETVYGKAGLAYDTRPHRPLSELVKVDLAIPGCPMEKEDFLRAVAALLNGDMPTMPSYPVCLECKMRENDCLLVARGIPCVGPITVAGCHARCPSYGVPCIGCRGPIDEANVASFRRILGDVKFDDEEIARRLRTFASPIFRPAEQEQEADL